MGIIAHRGDPSPYHYHNVEELNMSNKYTGTQTEKNLMAAFAGESEARNKYIVIHTHNLPS